LIVLLFREAAKYRIRMVRDWLIAAVIRSIVSPVLAVRRRSG
jgi:hypothetical protein